MSKSRGIGIVGCGLMGQQRAKSLNLISQNCKVESVFDPDSGKAQRLAETVGCQVANSLDELVTNPQIELVIVAVPHWTAKDATVAALKAGKHVLCEKPLGIDTKEAREIIDTARVADRLVTPGFNYRFYPGYQAAARALKAGTIGQLTHIRAELGHGARPGYETEWKTKKALCGGGALLDPGIHLIDLIRFFAGEVRGGTANLLRSFWDIDVCDNAFVHLEMESGVHVQLHISITEWRSRSEVNLFGRDGEIQVTGRSGFYGAQEIRIKKRWDWIEPVSPEVLEKFPSQDISFAAEISAFLDRLDGKDAMDLATESDGLRALEIIERLYADSPIHDRLLEQKSMPAVRA